MRSVIAARESTMFDHISIGTGDIKKAGGFYDAALAPLGRRQLSEDKASLGYGDKAVQFWVLAVAKPVPANVESGLHLCFAAKSRAAVDGFHAAALAQGGTDNGKPGLRKDYGPDYYAAFVIDPDGYRLEAFCNRKG
jgi:catechol 2,3-dioxygenase-like lactoylglutathione lyase family enzyme